MHTLSFIIFTLNLQKAITSNAIWNVYKGTELRASAFDVSSERFFSLIKLWHTITRLDNVMFEFQYPPIFTMKKLSNGNYSYGGLVYEILGWMTEYLNIT